MSRQSVKRCRAWGVFGAALALSAATLALDAGRTPALACATTPCNTGVDYTAEVAAQYQKDLQNSKDSEYWLLSPLFMGTGAGGAGTGAGGAINPDVGSPGVGPNGPNLSDHLGMYVGDGQNGVNGPTGWGGIGGGAVFHGNGFGLTDTAGAIPAGKGPSLRDELGEGTIYGTFDASRFVGLPSGQSLLLAGAFNYSRDNLNSGLRR